MKMVNKLERNLAKKKLGKLLMMVGLLGFFLPFLLSILMIQICFDYEIIYALIYIVPVCLLIIGYKIYSKHE